MLLNSFRIECFRERHYVNESFEKKNRNDYKQSWAVRLHLKSFGRCFGDVLVKGKLAFLSTDSTCIVPKGFV